MGDGERVELVVAQQSRRTAGGAAPALRRRIGQAIAAEARAHGKPSGQIAFPFTAERAPRPRDLGRIEAGAVGKSQQQALIGEHMLQDAGEKAGRSCGVADRVGRDAARAKKTGHSLRVFSDEGKRLNRQQFGCFLRLPWALIHRRPFAFP